MKKLRRRGATNAFVTYIVAAKAMRSTADAKRLNLFEAGIQAFVCFSLNIKSLINQLIFDLCFSKYFDLFF